MLEKIVKKLTDRRTFIGMALAQCISFMAVLVGPAVMKARSGTPCASEECGVQTGNCCLCQYPESNCQEQCQEQANIRTCCWWEWGDGCYECFCDSGSPALFECGGQTTDCDWCNGEIPGWENVCSNN